MLSVRCDWQINRKDCQKKTGTLGNIIWKLVDGSEWVGNFLSEAIPNSKATGFKGIS